PDAGSVVRHDRGAGARELHGARALLPLDPAPPARRAQRAELPVALGHRLVLVLPGLRCPAPGGPQALAAAAAAQRRLLADHALGAAARLVCGAPAPPRAGAPGARGPGRRDPARPDRRLPALVPARGPDRAAVAVPRPAAGGLGRPGRRAAVAALPD